MKSIRHTVTLETLRERRNAATSEGASCWKEAWKLAQGILKDNLEDSDPRLLEDMLEKFERGELCWWVFLNGEEMEPERVKEYTPVRGLYMQQVVRNADGTFSPMSSVIRDE